MNRATNLDEAYRVCDPDRPSLATDERYVDLSSVRGAKVIAAAIAWRIRRCDGNPYYQELLAGHGSW